MSEERHRSMDAKAAEKLRLAAALRANLRRRKAARERPDEQADERREPKPAGEREG